MPMEGIPVTKADNKFTINACFQVQPSIPLGIARFVWKLSQVVMGEWMVHCLSKQITVCSVAGHLHQNDKPQGQMAFVFSYPKDRTLDIGGCTFFVVNVYLEYKKIYV
jgi:hypothetical protein